MVKNMLFLVLNGNTGLKVKTVSLMESNGSIPQPNNLKVHLDWLPTTLKVMDILFSPLDRGM